MTQIACEETYGVLPCSTSLPGSIVLILSYGYMLLQGARLLSDGSELLLQVLNPGIIGGLLLPVLGALPDSLVIVVSGLGGSHDEAAEQVSVGVGTLAGSTIMLLTVAWGSSLLVGRCDLDARGTAVSKQLTHRWSLSRTGVTTDAFTPKGAVIMVASVGLYAIVQVPAFLGQKEGIASLIGAIVCLVMLVAYCIFQVVYPELQRRKMDRARHRQWRSAAVRALQSHVQAFGGMLDDTGNLNHKAVRSLFTSFDSNGDGAIDEGELKGLLVGLSLSSDGSGRLEHELRYWMQEADKNGSGSIDYQEFCRLLHRWIQEKIAHHEAHQRRHRQARTPRGGRRTAVCPLLSQHSLPDEEALRAGELSEEEEEEDQEETGEDSGSQDGSGKEQQQSPKAVVRRAVLLLLAGTVLCAVFSDPVVDAVAAFSKASGIPPFYVAFCALPFASNASELVSSLYFASRRQRKNISLTFSQVYGAVTMNNTMCLGLFLLVMHTRQLPWTYSSEVLVTVGATALVGLLGYMKTTFRSFWAIPVLLLYPLSILTVWGLDSLGFR